MRHRSENKARTPSEDTGAPAREAARQELGEVDEPGWVADTLAKREQLAELERELGATEAAVSGE